MALSPRVQQLLGSMSLEQKVGQVFIFTFVSLQQALNDMKYHPGGYVRIYTDALTAARQHETLQRATEIPLTISADFERGIGSTVTGAVDSVGNMCIGATRDEKFAYNIGRMISEEALAMGVNMNYVPVLDVNVNEQNPIINIRAFGGDPEIVATMGAGFIRGSRDAGIATCGKHFPGHGDTQTDTHTSLGTIDVSRERLDAVELVPFRAAIEAGVDSIMSAHLWVPALETEKIPATMSRRIMHHLLREEMGFSGVTVSDALEMGGITKHFSAEEAIVRAFNAGMDQLIMPTDNRRATHILAQAVRDRRVSEERLDEAVGRLLTMKETRGILETGYTVPTDLNEKLNTPGHYATAVECGLAGISLLKNNGNALPLTPESKAAVIMFSNSEDPRSYFLDPKTFGAHCERFSANVTSVSCATLDERMVHEFNVINRSIEAARNADVIIIGAYVKVVINLGSVGLEKRYVDFVAQLAALGKPVVFVSFGNPYLIKQFPGVAAYVCAYGASEASQDAAAQLIFGKSPFRGTAPVSITLDSH